MAVTKARRNYRYGTDPYAQDLAEHVLVTDTHPPREHEQRVRSLTRAIQETIADWLDANGQLE